MEELYACFLTSTGVSTDTRNIAPGSVFFALKGANFNGNAFAKQAIESGAAAVVVDEAEYAWEGSNCFLVQDALKTLQDMAYMHRQRSKARIVALTGSNGKTTTKELLHVAVASKYNTIATQGNLNNHIGVPLTLLRIQEDTEYAIIEMGANHPGEIDFLCSIADPDWGMITNIGKAHLEGFGGYEGVIQTKTEMYRYLKKKEGLLFVNADDELLVEKSEGCKREFYGSGSAGNLVDADFISVAPLLKLAWKRPSGHVEIQTQLLGKYNFYNVLAAIAVGVSAGVEPELIIEQLEAYVSENNRSQVVHLKSNTIILDAYNANPSSMQAALESFDALETDRKFFILGDMFELGEYSETEHRKVVDMLQSKKLKGILVGEAFQRAASDVKEFMVCEESKVLKDLLATEQLEDTTILVKGSRGMRLEQVLDYL